MNQKLTNPILPSLEDCNVAVLGLGYVGLPLIVSIAKYFSNKNLYENKIIGFDISKEKVDSLRSNIDPTKEIDIKDYKFFKRIEFSSDENSLRNVDLFIVCVPTPININNQPNLNLLKKASSIVGSQILNSNLEEKLILQMVI